VYLLTCCSSQFTIHIHVATAKPRNERYNQHVLSKFLTILEGFAPPYYAYQQVKEIAINDLYNVLGRYVASSSSPVTVAP
jgi:hypothetical protein